MACVTRKSFECPLFKAVSDLQNSQLPTRADTIKAILFRKISLKTNCGKDPSIKIICKDLANDIAEIYISASIPVVTVKQISDLLISYHGNYQNLMKSYKARRTVKSFNDKVKSFIEKSKCLFDFASCKCCDFDCCNCPKGNKVPKIEQSFLLDQRNERKMIIGSIDVGITLDLTRRAERNFSSCKAPVAHTSSDINFSTSDEAPDDVETTDTEDEEYTLPTTSMKRLRVLDKCDAPIEDGEEKASQLTLKKCKTLPVFAEACDRFGISDRGAAFLSTSLLDDIGVVTSSSSDHIIDKNKVRRERSKSRKLQINTLSVYKLTSIYFDGKRDSTLINEKRGEKFYKKKITEEHISLVSEPESKYIGHFTPGSGTARNIYGGIIRLCENLPLSLHNLIAIGSDGTNVNTGTKGGIIKLIEEFLDRPLHWFICMLHGNELPLRHLFSNLDGKTSGPRCYTGPIGKDLQNCETKLIVSFTPVAAVLDEVDVSSLSTDQKYLYEIHQAVSAGAVSYDLSTRSPGGLNLARWITTASRILRLYVSTQKPSDNLVSLTKFVMEVYAPMWFTIKTHQYVQSGPKHICKMLSLIRTQNRQVQKIVIPVVMRNAYFAHPEIILISMVSDERPHIRELGWRRIKKCRLDSSKMKVRSFKIPTLNVECNDYVALINWQAGVSEPPLTMHYTDEEIDKHIEAKTIYQCPKYPLHTQAVERTIKIVSDVSSQVCSHEARDGLIRNRLASREKISKFESKQDYNK